MKIDTLNEDVEAIIEWKRDEFLKVNHEYQRAPVWTRRQQKMFIDSVFRGYSIPAFYFHFVEKISGRMESRVSWIIDGQQRVNALSDYKDGAFSLFDPNQEGEFKFPNFVKNKATPWAGKKFDDLTAELKDQFLKQPVIIYEIKTDEDDEIRDLFIRLQGGTPLSPQDKRDAWPGKFTEYVLKIGGKHEIAKYSGHDFFNKCVKGDGKRKREQAAQTYMLYATRRRRKARDIASIGSKEIDDFYLENISFDKNGEEPQRYESILTRLEEVFRGHPKMTKHHAIHLILTMDALLDDYRRGWESLLPNALHLFKKRCTAAKAEEEGVQKPEYVDYMRYNNHAGSGGDRSSAIQTRHGIFMSEMLKLMNYLQDYRKDPERIFSDAVREAIYYRDNRECQASLMDGNGHLVLWENAEIHHVTPHAKGGETDPDNGALVCKEHHPKNDREVEEFAQWWWEKREKQLNPDTTGSKISRKGSFHPLPPDGTLCQFPYKKENYQAVIKNGKVLVTIDGQEREFKSFSAASKALVGLNRNGWTDWHINTPDSGDRWILATYWRDGFTA